MGEMGKLEFRLETDKDDEELVFLGSPLATPGSFGCVFLRSG